MSFINHIKNVIKHIKDFFKTSDTTAFEWASYYGNLNVIKFLVNLDVQQSIEDIHKHNDCAVRIASERGHLNIVQYLVGLGADFRAESDYAVQWASYYGHLDVVKYLVGLGANFRADDDFAIRWASFKGHLDVVKYLVSVGASFRTDNNSAVQWAFANGHSEVVHYLVSLGAYHPSITIDFNLINGLYISGHYVAIDKLLSYNKHKISNDKMEQFNLIKQHVNKIIKARKWNEKLLDKLKFADILFQFNLS